jgi:hypothetical protein
MERGQWRDLVRKLMKLRVPGNTGKVLSNYTKVGLPRNTQNHGVRFQQNSPYLDFVSRYMLEAIH